MGVYWWVLGRRSYQAYFSARTSFRKVLQLSSYSTPPLSLQSFPSHFPNLRGNLAALPPATSRQLQLWQPPSPSRTVHSSQHPNYETQNNVITYFPASLQPYLRLMRVDRPIGTWIIFWPGAWSLCIASPTGDLPNTQLLVLFLMGSFVMRGAGCTINDLWDRDFDRKVTRTRGRPLASGELTALQALVFLSGQLSVALAILLSLNTYTIALGASSVLLVAFYPLMKRWTHWPQLSLGLTLNWGALMGYSAVQGSCDWSVCLPLYSACVAWTLLYDTIYAYQDVEDDRQIGLKSIALLLGPKPHPFLAGCGVVMSAMLTVAGLASQQLWPYYCGVLACLSHTAWQVATVDHQDPEDCLNKFRSNNHIGVWLLLAMVASSLLKVQS